MKTTFYLWGLILFFSWTINIAASGQGVSVNDDNSDPDPSAILDVKSTEKGLLIPRMTGDEIRTIPHPADGLQAYNTDDGKLYIYVELEGVWKEVSYGAGSLTPFFICGEPLVDERDGKSYATVLINDKCWMAENLNYGTMISTGQPMNNNGIHEKYCYNNNTSYCDNLGGLYQWNEMMDYSTAPGAQGICPPAGGWHIPTDEEWFAMENYLDPSIGNISQVGWRGINCGMKLKNTGSGPPFNWPSPNYGTNESGFTALPGGIRNTSGGSSANPTNATFWTSTSSGSLAVERELYYQYNTVFRNFVPTVYGMSVRCVSDQ